MPTSATKFLFMTCARPVHLPHCMSSRPLVPTAHRRAIAIACASLLLITPASSCSDTCWAVGNTAHIKCFIGISWSFSLLDETVCREFVDSVRLGISACLSANVQNSQSSIGSGANISLFQAEQPPQLQLQPPETAGLVDTDEFSSLSLGKSFGGSPAAAIPASRFPTISVAVASLLCAAPVEFSLFSFQSFSGPVPFLKKSKSKFVAGLGART